MIINCVAYENGRKLADISADDISTYIARPNCFVWVALKEPEPAELRAMQHEFGLHELALEDAQHGHQRPKIDEYNGSLFVVLHLIELENDDLNVGELAIFAVPAALQQHRFSPIVKSARHGSTIEWVRLLIVLAILLAALVTNIFTNAKFPAVSDAVPVLGIAVWVVILLAAPLRKPDWKIMPETIKGSIFLLALVTAASMMPVEALPVASWQTALGLGFVSAVFDNIPLTALALKQGGYDWGYLAYAVGFGGSMIWFGSSAGVALANMYPEAKSVGLWLRHGWHVAVAYVIGFFFMLAMIGWHPDADHTKRGMIGAPDRAVVAGVPRG